MIFIAKTFFGLEDILLSELESLGAREPQKLNRAVSFSGDLRLLYRANLELRTALRILLPLKRVQVQNEKQLYDEVMDIDWSAHLSLESTFSVDSVVNSPFFKHSKYVALKTKDAIVDQFRKNTGKRPSIDTENPDCRINIHIFKDQCSISLDSSGSSLHKRSYRKFSHQAPLNEVLAAGLVLMTGYDGTMPFIDPMCGSGTILIEAAMIAKKIPPGILRDSFGFMKWKNFDSNTWDQVLSDAKSKIREAPEKILGSDSNLRSVKLTRQNLESLKIEEVMLSRKSFFDLSKPTEGTILVSNPPYGERMPVDEIEQLYIDIGNHLKRNFSGSKAFFISSNVKALKRIGLRPFFKKTVFNGALECRYFGFDLYDGSRRGKPKSPA